MGGPAPLSKTVSLRPACTITSCWKAVLVPAGSWIPRKYLSAFGIDRFVVLEDYLDDAGRSEAAAAADRILEHEPTLADIRELSFHGARNGRVSNPLASASSRMRSVLGSQLSLRPTSIEIRPRCPGMAE